MRYLALSKVTSRHSSVSSEGAVNTLTSHDILPVSNSVLFLLRGGILCWCATVLLLLIDHTLFRAVGSIEAITRILVRKLRSNRMEVVTRRELPESCHLCILLVSFSEAVQPLSDLCNVSPYHPSQMATSIQKISSVVA
jgi:hypothetical protein